VKKYYNKKFKPNYELAEEVSNNVKRLLAPNPSPFTFHGTGTYIIGNKEIAIIDPGPRIESHVENLLNIIDKDSIIHIFITHTHADHSPAAELIKKERKAITYGFGPYPLDKYETKFEEGHDLNFKPDIFLKDGEIIGKKDWTIRAIHTPGHTSNHMCFGLEENSILFTGDHVMGWSTTVIIPPDGDMTDYIKSLEKVAACEYKTFFPTHGAPIKEPKKFVRALIGHRKMREKQILDELEKTPLCIDEMVRKFYKNTDKMLWPAAEKSLLASLLSLKKKGKLANENNKSTNSRWKLI